MKQKKKKETRKKGRRRKEIERAAHIERKRKRLLTVSLSFLSPLVGKAELEQLHDHWAKQAVDGKLNRQQFATGLAELVRNKDIEAKKREQRKRDRGRTHYWSSLGHHRSSRDRTELGGV